MNKIEFDEIKETIEASGIENMIAEQTINHSSLIVSFVPDIWKKDFRSHGFTVYAQYHDYWIDKLTSPGSAYGGFDFLREEDCGIASEISVACRGQSRGFEGEPPEWFADWLRGEDGMNNSVVLVRRINNRIVGISCTATYAHDSEKGAVVWVRMLAVHPDFQGRGIGKNLLLQTLQYGVEHGAKRAFLHADVENTTAICIYTNAGFTSRGGEGQIDMIWREKKMDNIKIREMTASESDLKGIANIHRDCTDPWGNIEECTAWITKRLERGFYIQVAEFDGKIVGHGEWIVSDEPDRKFVYLGMLQIDKDYQRKGIGRIMIADGIEYAKKNNCELIVTIPDMDENADIFYRKCGFKDERKSHSLKMLTEPYKDYKFEYIDIDKIPFSAIKEKKYIFGKGQLCSRHMWEVYNEKPSTDDRFAPAILLPDGTYIQIDVTHGGYLMIWSNSTNCNYMIKSALSFGYSLGLPHLNFDYFEDEESFFAGFEVYDKKQEADFEQIYNIKNLTEEEPQ
ncbi:MAG: GNAT family N-acetyltransferase [Oscillospiraceae bacterium]|nr:GNAT family N-acetyltransferase [Oscillospiraceae bacterium]